MRTSFDIGLNGFFWGITVAFVVAMFADGDTVNWTLIVIMFGTLAARGCMELGKRGLIGTPDAATSPQEDEHASTERSRQ